MATLSISFTIADNAATGIKDDFCAYYGWKATIKDGGGNDIPNPESQNAFIKRKIGEFIKDSVKAYRISAAAETARQTAQASAESGVVLS